MGSGAAELGGPAAEPERGAGDDARRVEELLRVNERLAAEVRSLTLGRTGVPRSGSMTAGRRLGVLIDERDTLRKLFEETRFELDRISAHRDELERHREELAAELQQLRVGWRGLLRRIRLRLLR
jgi:chromosome segregation ATPase